MQCFSPIHVPDPKNPGMRIAVPCGKCAACVENRAMEWYVRLKLESKYSDSCIFVTLTYEDNHLPPPRYDSKGYPHFDVSKTDVQHYHYRLRKSLGERSKKVKYFAVSEYGPEPKNGWLFRPHYHIIYFNIQPNEYTLLERSWNKGFVEISEVTDGRLGYVSGYSTEKLFVPPGAKPTFSLISKGLALSYVDHYKEFHKGQLDRFFVPLDGSKFPLPRYLKERLYDEDERAVYADQCSQKAMEKFQTDLENCCGDEFRLADHYSDLRRQCVQKLRQKHKKRKN